MPAIKSLSHWSRNYIATLNANEITFNMMPNEIRLTNSFTTHCEYYKSNLSCLTLAQLLHSDGLSLYRYFSVNLLTKRSIQMPSTLIRLCDFSTPSNIFAYPERSKQHVHLFTPYEIVDSFTAYSTSHCPRLSQTLKIVMNSEFWLVRETNNISCCLSCTAPFQSFHSLSHS